MKTEAKPHLIKKLADVKCQRVDGSIVPGLEEAAQVEHLFTGPKSEHVSLDGVLCIGKENLEKHLKMEDFFSCALDYSWKINCGEVYGQGGDDLKLEILDGLLDEVDEVDDIQAADDLSAACEGFQLDIEFPEKFSESDCAPHDLRNLNSQSHDPGFSGSCSSAGGISESSVATVQESNSQNGVLKKMVSRDLHHTFKSKFVCQAPIMDTVRPNIEHMQSFDESDDDEKPLISFILSTKSVKSSVEVTKGGTLLRQKRLRKPTSRYIEEFSRNSTTSAKKCLKLGLQGDLPQVASELQRQRGRLKKIVPKLELESEDEQKRTKRSRTVCDRRKHQRMWTLAEVIKLVDGIAQYGVGRWTDIKWLLFASSAHRTPVDLRDKWRNLLRSSSAQKHNKRELQCETKLKHAVRHLPMPLVCRIHELATIHPYPMARCPKKPSEHHYVPLSKQLRTAKVSPFYSQGRNLRRKKCS
ncbi:Detected protein of confused Function [Hibiscus syriacus]|uniref:Detected protein of confused Function n=1 Tax=Hibiscus syriacus TaxID=106335 RepID=A0A6A2Z120_HIBSY|nr:uncharacterized protein LOC120153996 [Hibiscus syriacus]XP_039021787.1 uncharacterized protein LOC120153996 [Hibiscus syriacus]KAE8684825.1 Detected protein of confused Function [Hibiscus syriacus]